MTIARESKETPLRKLAGTSRAAPWRRATLLALAFAHGAHAQVGAQAAQRSPREAAPIDVTGYWVAIVSEDWRVRMMMAQKGDWEFIGLNRDGVRAAEASDPVNADACMAYGAAGIMRIPTRLRIAWEDDSTLRIDTDAGMQTRLLRFGATEQSTAEPTRQGLSVAEWRAGELAVSTTNLLPGYYFKHGVPYSGEAVMTEYVALIPDDHGVDYLFFTTTVDDPRYLNGEFIRTLTFKRAPDDAGWRPEPCSVP